MFQSGYDRTWLANANGVVMTTLSVLLLPERDGSGFTVEVPALPGVVTFGATGEEALAMAQEAIELYLETAQDHGWTVESEQRSPEILQLQVESPRPLKTAS